MFSACFVYFKSKFDDGPQTVVLTVDNSEGILPGNQDQTTLRLPFAKILNFGTMREKEIVTDEKALEMQQELMADLKQR